MMLRKTYLSLAVAGALTLASAAYAGPVQNFSVFVPGSGLVSTASALDWNEAGSGVATGVGPFSDSTLLPVGPTPFQFLYQANLVSVTGIGAPAGLRTVSDASGFAAGQFEYTVAASFFETVSASFFTGPGNTDPFARFAPVLGNSALPARVSIFFDDGTSGTAANTLAGTGFDDGLEIARFTINTDPTFPTTSTFTAITGSGTGSGSTRIHGALLSPDDFVNPAFLDGVLDFIFDFHFQSNLNFPAGTSTTASFHGTDPGAATCGLGDCYPAYTLTTNDILFKVDGQNEFSAIPEPGTLLLTGISLLGLGLAKRRTTKGECCVPA